MSQNGISRRGLMLVLSSPSGAGKTSISRKVLELNEGIELSISVTTRKKRPGEVGGRDYHFIDRTEFDLMINRQQLLEHAKVFDNYYGTPKAPVEATLAQGRDVLFDIEWQGTQQLAATARQDLVSVFILPSTGELERRLKTRAQDSAATVAKRMAKAADEMSHWPEYDYIIVNRDFDRSVAEVQSILTAERLRRSRQVGLPDFVKRLQQGY
jgi:guanylate kinase